MKKGRHRRFEEARALKRSHEVDYDDLFDSMSDEDDTAKPEHEAWADMADEGDDDTAAAAADGDDEAEAESA